MTRTEPQTPVDDSGDEKGGRSEVRTAWIIAPDDQETGNELQNQRLLRTAHKLAVRKAKSFGRIMKGIHMALATALVFIFGCSEKEPMPLPYIQTVYPPVPEPLDKVWLMSSEWYGFMGVAIGISSNQYYYWFYSDVISGDEPHYPVTGSYTLEDDVLMMVGSEHRLYSNRWLVTTNAERICLWAERDVGDLARLLIPDENFEATDPFANQKELKAEPEPGEVREISSRPSD